MKTILSAADNINLFPSTSAFPELKPLWAQVTVTPELNNSTVFNNGILQGSRAKIFIDGNTFPHSTSPMNIV